MGESIIQRKSFSFALEIVELYRNIAKMAIALKEARETKYWLRRANQRKLVDAEIVAKLDAELELLAREINGCINHQKSRAANR